MTRNDYRAQIAAAKARRTEAMEAAKAATTIEAHNFHMNEMATASARITELQMEALALETI